MLPLSATRNPERALILCLNPRSPPQLTGSFDCTKTNERWNETPSTSHHITVVSLAMRRLKS